MSAYEKSVFVNCPFDDTYGNLFYAILFTILDCDFTPRCAREKRDSDEVRISKITGIIADCKLGIHDISRIELDTDNNLPRFNMPFELGIFLGAKEFGREQHTDKRCLILEGQKFQFQKCLSDIGGQDPICHDNKVVKVIQAVTSWLSDLSPERGLDFPGFLHISDRFATFMEELPDICFKLGRDINNLAYNDLVRIMAKWLALRPAPKNDDVFTNRAAVPVPKQPIAKAAH